MSLPGPKYPIVVGYKLTGKIGGGGFSTVFQATNFDSCEVAACKFIPFTQKTTPNERKAVEKEMRIHAALKHDNVLNFINAAVVELKHGHLHPPGIYMLMELAAGGDLFDKIAPEIGVSDKLAHHYFSQMVEGMKYVHDQGVCHRDLKPENLLLDITGRLKITDFGLSAVFKLKETGRTRQLSERCGSLPYVAPELSSDEPYYAEPIDVWGIGVILFTMLAGNTPWDQPTKHSIEYRRYISGEFIDDHPWSDFSSEALSLVCGLLTIEPRDRFTLAQACQHPWYQQPNTIAEQGPTALADHLTQSLRTAGDLELASAPMDTDQNMEEGDEDEMMASAPPRSFVQQSQFTQQLQLFTQTQTGPRYIPHLTRFYSALPPAQLLPLLHENLVGLGVQVRVPQENNTPAPIEAPPPDEMEDIIDRERREREPALKLRVGGFDAKKVAFKGWVTVEKFTRHGVAGSFCVMARDMGNPISWRQLWKALIMRPAVYPHVLRKK